MTDALAQKPVSATLVRLLIALLALLAIPHFANLSPWLIGYFYAAVAWRLAAMKYPRLLPRRWLLGLLTLAGLANVVLNTNLFDGRASGTALLVVMLGLKLLEMKNRRDVFVIIFLGFFLAMTQFLFHQGLWLTLYLLTLAALLATLLIALNRVRPDVRKTFFTAGRMVIGGLPLALALFVLFPRLDSPLWQVTLDKPRGVTGISDRMRMGMIGELSRSEATAFRVRFLDRTPSARQLYWRGLVLWREEEGTWYPLQSVRPARDLQVEPDSEINYEVTYEPSGQPWVFALELPGETPAGLVYNEDYRLVEQSPIHKRASYRLRSFTAYRAQGLREQQRDMGLALPDRVSARTRALVRQWLDRHGTSNPRAIVDAALAHFNTEPFVYTLEPGLLGDDPVDTFLFETRRGFCEHYAASFTVLMRLAGIPTRIVLGYQGGEYNPLAEHWVIRQSDAHAWTEVWLDEQGWVRIDPTAAVAAERIEQSIDSAQSVDNDEVVFRVDHRGLLGAMWQDARWMIDAIEIGWHRWVIGFSHDRQASLLQKLGIDNLAGYTHMLALLGALALGSVFAYLLSLVRRQPHVDETLRQWQKLQHYLQRKGLSVPPWFGPQHLLEAASARWPEQRDALQRIVRLYIHLRYGRVRNPRLQRQLRESIRGLKLQ
jgi:transglutaminase-like putative cysteine protease